MTPQLWTPPKRRIVAPHVYPVEIVERHAAPALGIGLGIGFPRSSGGSSPHPALAYGNAIAVYEADNATPALWPCKLSGGAYDMTGPTGKQPTVVAGGWDGSLATTRYDGTKRYQSAALGVALAGRQSFSWILSAKPTSDTATRAIMALYDASSGDDQDLYYLNGSPDSWRFLRNTSAVKFAGGGTAAANTRYVLGCIYDGSTEELLLYVNGSAVAASGSFTLDPADYSIAILGGRVIFEEFIGDIGALWVYDEALDATAVANASAATSWGNS